MLLSNALSRFSRALAPMRAPEGLSRVEHENIHLAMLEGNVAVVLEASGAVAGKTMRDLMDQGTRKLIVVAEDEAKKQALLNELPKQWVDDGRVVAVLDKYKPKENVEELLNRVRKAAGLDEKTSGVTSVFEYQSTAETYSNLGNAVDFEEDNSTAPKL